MDRSGQIFSGRYRVQRPLGQGGMATVYLAVDEKLEKAVALKVLDAELAANPRAARRFVQEAKAAAQIRHPNVIDITDYGVAEDGAAYLVMELLRGEDLGATLQREGPMRWSRVGPIALQICAALAAAHRAGVVHRDVKPSNLFRVSVAGDPDTIKVLDFGIARLDDPQAAIEPTTAGMILGTPEYIAPEVAAGDKAGPSADIYALGAVMYKLLTGKPVFEADAPAALLHKHIFDPPVPPRRRAPGREIPAAAERVVLSALAKDPADRPPDMMALARAIAGELPEHPAPRWVEASPLPPTASLRVETPRPAPAPPRRRALALAGALSLALVALVALATRDEDEPPGSAGPLHPVLSDRVQSPALPERLEAPPPPLATAPATDAPATDAPATDAPRPTPAPLPEAAAPAPPRDGARRRRTPPPDTGPSLDAAAVHRLLEASALKVRACALAADMFRGEIVLSVHLDAQGRIDAVSPPADARRVDASALACIRRELVTRQAASGPGELLHTFDL